MFFFLPIQKSKKFEWLDLIAHIKGEKKVTSMSSSGTQNKSLTDSSEIEPLCAFCNEKVCVSVCVCARVQACVCIFHIKLCA